MKSQSTYPLRLPRSVKAEAFARLTKDEPRIDTELRRFLPQSFNMKAVADYEPGPGAVIPAEQAAAAIATSSRFVECVEELLR